MVLVIEAFYVSKCRLQSHVIGGAQRILLIRSLSTINQFRVHLINFCMLLLERSSSTLVQLTIHSHPCPPPKGPGFFLKGGSTGFRSMNADSPCAKWYKTFTQKWSKPSAIVIISAHWEERDAICVTSGAKHPLLYDYYGFPSHTYELDYPCPGHPVLAGHIVDFLRQGGFQARGDKTRGYDHGVFIPLKLMYPEADIPVVQVRIPRCRRRKYVRMESGLKGAGCIGWGLKGN